MSSPDVRLPTLHCAINPHVFVIVYLATAIIIRFHRIATIVRSKPMMSSCEHLDPLPAAQDWSYPEHILRNPFRAVPTSGSVSDLPPAICRTISILAMPHNILVCLLSTTVWSDMTWTLITRHSYGWIMTLLDIIEAPATPR